MILEWKLYAFKMKFVGHIIIIILFLNYVHVQARKFDCSQANPVKKGTQFLEKLNGKVYWIIKHLGYNETNLGNSDNNYYKKMFGRVNKTYTDEELNTTTYMVLDRKQQTLSRQDAYYEIHDEFLAFHTTRIDSYTIHYNGNKLETPYNLQDGLEKALYKEMAVIHYNPDYDFIIIQSCQDKYVTVEIGDKNYRDVATGNEDLWMVMQYVIIRALEELNIKIENQDFVHNELHDIFK